MTTEAAISLVTAGAALLGSLYTGVYRQAKMESRVELLWALLLRRGVAEALVGGVMEKQSPLRLKVQFLEHHPEITGRVQQFYAESGRKLNDSRLIEAMERKFGVELSLLSASTQTGAGSWLVALAFMLRPEMEMFKQFDTHDWRSPKHAGAGA
jgi:hypothetical protein